MAKRIAFPFLALALAPLLALGCRGPSDTPQESVAVLEDGVGTAVPTSAYAEGQQLYQGLCWACHGRSGRGDGPAAKADLEIAPPNFQTGGYADMTAAEFQDRVRESLDGVDPSHPHMQKVAPLLDTDRFMAALAFIPILTYPAEMPGSALMGRATFMDRCAPCHGEAADGSGAVAGMLQIPAADLRSDPFVAARDFDGVFRLIKEGGSESVHGSSMPTWGAVFDDGTIWDLVAYLATLQPGVLQPPRAAG